MIQKSTINTLFLMRIFFFFQLKVYRGYHDNELNTDNAWKEVIVLNFHDNTGEFFKDDVILPEGIFLF